MTIVFQYANPTDHQRAKDLSSVTEKEAIGRARMQASLIKDQKKIIGRFEAVMYIFGSESPITQIFANRFLTLHPGSVYEEAFFEGAQNRMKSYEYNRKKEEELKPISRLLYELGFFMMDKKLGGLL